MKIPFNDLRSQYIELKETIQWRINKVLEHGQYIMGPEVYELEEKLAHYTGSKYCISVASGTKALLISLMALGVKSGDEVITTPFTWISSVEVIALLGATPVLVDVEADTANINADLIEKNISSRTKAIMPVSLFGQPADIDKINSIAKKNGNIPVIEDAAQSFGATYKQRFSCNLSSIGCTSFFPSKPLGCYGDGGAIFTNDEKYASIMKEIRLHGKSEKYLHNRIGIDGRMDTLQCAVVLAKLDCFDRELLQRELVANRYNKLIASYNHNNKPIPLSVRSECKSVYAQYCILTEKRDYIQNKLAELGIPTAIYYPIPINEQMGYKHICRSNATPNARHLSKKILSLPMSPYLEEKTQKVIIDDLIGD